MKYRKFISGATTSRGKLILAGIELRTKKTGANKS